MAGSGTAIADWAPDRLAATMADLVAAQFPQYRDLPVVPVRTDGTVNHLLRLGDELVIRLPRDHSRDDGIDRERHWLPRLAPRLPLEIPRIVAVGGPAGPVRQRWVIGRWIPGRDLLASGTGGIDGVVEDLASFVRALHRTNIRGRLIPAAGSVSRGVPLARRHAATLEALAALAGRIETAPLRRIWERALAARPWQGPPVLLHGDIHAANLLARDGRLAAVLDFGAMATGDPACDLMFAWNLLDASQRAELRRRLAVDDDRWMRACGWAVSVALIAMPVYWDSNPTMMAIARHALREALLDYGD